MEEGTFVEWLKREGETVRPGDALFVLESEKAAETIEALDGGILRLTEESPKPGETVKVGQVIGYVADEGEALPLGHGVAPGQPAAPKPAGVDADESQASPGRVDSPGRRPAVSPRARRVARELGLPCETLQGSGRMGRVCERDVRAAAEGAGGKLIPHTSRRRTIAARMIASLTQAAPVTLTTKADVTELIKLRDWFKAGAVAADDLVPSYTELILKLTATTLRQHPLLQAQWREDGLFVPEGVHLAVAVAAEEGLLAPVVREVDRLTLLQLSARVRELTTQARAGALRAEDLRGGTFTVTNLGMFGIDAFTPVLHLPQSAILGVGRIVREPAVVDDRIVPRDMMTLSLTFDHRVVDGAPAARFLDALRCGLEQHATWVGP
jgi:pyruvate dehydrogenase E2 component (dihydrolipoamide acetyltransferase)